MKVVIILGSRDPKGQTANAADSLKDAMAGKGIQAEKLFLPVMKLERCRQCEDNGWGICRSKGQCIIEDDFGSIVDKLKKSDAVVFATPVYFGDLSESMKAFLDRLRRICMNENGQMGINDKIAAGICVAGGGGGGSHGCIINLEKVLATCGFNVLDMVSVRRQNTTLKINVLKITGEWLAECILGK
jgi:multimeric flavodoxin WrbA